MSRRVYFIRPIGMDGPVKIGCSASPNGRRKSLATWSPFALEIIAEIDGDFELERRFHALFRDTHQRREWFDWSPLMAATVEAISAGAFDVASLPPPFGIACYRDGKKVERTPEQRRQFSFSQRDQRISSRTGWRSPVRICDIVYRGDAEEIAAAEAYFAAPHVHGIPIASEWAAKRRAKYLAELAAPELAKAS